MFERKGFNRKRRIASPKPKPESLSELVQKISYIGSSYHKRNPGDFGLIPPSQPRPDKTLCDGAGILSRASAQRLLEEGARRGLVSDNRQDGFPKHIWAVTEENVVLEAKYNNSGPGHYHGYPLPVADPFREIVLKHWQSG